MSLFPLFAHLEGREVLVVGGGEVATRKVQALLDAGAQVRVHARELNATMLDWHRQGRVSLLHGDFDAAWLDDVWLVVAATDDRTLNSMLAAEAGNRRRLINVVDDAELCTFHFPAIVDRSPVQIAISSGGSAPMLARRLRERFEMQLDDSLGALADLFAAHRESIRARFPDLRPRRQWFDDVLEGSIPRLLQAGASAEAEQALKDSLSFGAAVETRGHIIVIDASQADPGLLTLKALRAMNLADVLVCDERVSPAVVRLARRDAARVVAPEDTTELTAMLADYSSKRLAVVYLAACSGTRSPRYVTMIAEFEQRGIRCDFLAGVAVEGSGQLIADLGAEDPDPGSLQSR